MHAKLADVFVDFLFIAVQVILFVEGVYPAGLFERNRKFGVAVFVCRHPDVYSYLRELLLECRTWLIEDRIERIVVPIINNASSKPLRRYVFYLATGRSEGDELKEETVVAVETHLKAALAQLANSRRRNPATGSLTWDMVAYTLGVELGDHWTQADGAEKKEIDLESKRIMPVKEADQRNPASLEIYVEQAPVPSRGNDT